MQPSPFTGSPHCSTRTADLLAKLAERAVRDAPYPVRDLYLVDRQLDQDVDPFTAVAGGRSDRSAGR